MLFIHEYLRCFVFEVFICFSEKEIFREEVHSLEVVRDKLKSKVAELEDDIKKLRDGIEQEKGKASLANEDEVQPSLHFSR